MQAMSFEELATLAQDSGNGWSIGSFGAIGEFVRDPDEPVTILRTPRSIELSTARGAMRLVDAKLACLAWDGLSSDGRGWTHNLALCAESSGSERGVVGAPRRDLRAIRAEDSGAWLVDLGVSRGRVRMCVRSRSEELRAILLEAQGRDLLASPALTAAVVAAQPHRVLLSPAGRIEVFQPIPGPHDLSPLGPHTHLLPRLVASGLMHSANDPIPEGWQAVLNLHPPRPWVGDRVNRLLDRERDDAFQALLARYGDAGEAELARSLVAEIEDDADPAAFAWPCERRRRVKARLILRRLTTAGDSRTRPWRERYDRVRMPVV